MIIQCNTILPQIKLSHMHQLVHTQKRSQITHTLSPFSERVESWVIISYRFLGMVVSYGSWGVICVRYTIRDYLCVIEFEVEVKDR